MIRRARPRSVAFFCGRCHRIYDGAPAVLTCPDCGLVLHPLFDQTGALTAKYLALRGQCCESYCRNCPYEGHRVDTSASSG